MYSHQFYLSIFGKSKGSASLNVLKSANGNERGYGKKPAGKVELRKGKGKGRDASAKHCSFLQVCNQVHGGLGL